MQTGKLLQKNIRIEEKPVSRFEHQSGYLQHIELEDGSTQKVTAVFSRVPFQQHSQIPEQLGCVLTEQGYLQTDEMQQTTIPGVYAAGDNTSPMRAVSNVIAAGTKAGAVINKDLIQEDFA